MAIPDVAVKDETTVEPLPATLNKSAVLALFRIFNAMSDELAPDADICSLAVDAVVPIPTLPVTDALPVTVNDPDIVATPSPLILNRLPDPFAVLTLNAVSAEPVPGAGNANKSTPINFAIS